MKKIVLVFMMLIGIQSILGQQKIAYGFKGGPVVSSAILPNLKLNRSIGSILRGDDVVKGVPQYANARLNYQLGGFISYYDRFGFSKLETNYTTTRIYKEVTFKNLITTSILDRKFSYLDIALSYNIFLNKNKKAFFFLGGGPSFLMEHSGNETPQKIDLRAFTGIGFYLNKNVCISTRAELGIYEVYKDSYIHHILIPISISFSL